MVAAKDDPQPTRPVRLTHRISAAGEAIVTIGGELDIATADAAVGYVGQVIDGHHRGPVIVDLAALRFCDAQGLSGLLRMADQARRAGCPFRLRSPSPPVVRILRITGLDRRFLAASGP